MLHWWFGDAWVMLGDAKSLSSSGIVKRILPEEKQAATAVA